MTRRRWLSSKDTTTVLIAIIGLLGTLATVYFGFLGNIAPVKETIKATQTAEARLVPLVPALDTFTPSPQIAVIPTSTENISLAPTNTLESKKDFGTSCIYSGVWTPYKGEAYQKDDKGCWQLLGFGFYAQDGELLLSVENNDFATQKGIYATIPQKARIEFDIQVNKIETPSDQKASISFGIIQASPVDPTNGKYLVYDFIGKSQQPDLLNIILRESSEKGTSDTVESNKLRISAGHNQVVMVIDGVRFQLYIDGNPVGDTITLSFNERCFWIGYSLPANSKLFASISNFSIQQK